MKQENQPKSPVQRDIQQLWKSAAGKKDLWLILIRKSVRIVHCLKNVQSGKASGMPIGICGLIRIRSTVPNGAGAVSIIRKKGITCGQRWNPQSGKSNIHFRPVNYRYGQFHSDLYGDWFGNDDECPPYTTLPVGQKEAGK